ncbi:hypothetical protein AAFF_G00125110 [Aldrovandia affinis]|uniref:Uncharacterized protein n=1 Tax=Aldrovandia affinis TaxID=143900 RepID=A0AAD7WA05_9TELE|nr:hypothetical protein AAFF_G00125110 [Aldrovandia affinis]
MGSLERGSRQKAARSRSSADSFPPGETGTRAVYSRHVTDQAPVRTAGPGPGIDRRPARRARSLLGHRFVRVFPWNPGFIWNEASRGRRGAKHKHYRRGARFTAVGSKAAGLRFKGAKENLSLLYTPLVFNILSLSKQSFAGAADAAVPVPPAINEACSQACGKIAL